MDGQSHGTPWKVSCIRSLSLSTCCFIAMIVDEYLYRTPWTLQLIVLAFEHLRIACDCIALFCVSFTDLHRIALMRLLFGSVRFRSSDHLQLLLCSLTTLCTMFKCKCNRLYHTRFNASEINSIHTCMCHGKSTEAI